MVLNSKIAVKAHYKKGAEPGKDLEVEVDVGALLEGINLTFGVIKEGVKGGKASNHLALLHSLLFADILHGGAYRSPVQSLPYYNTGNYDLTGLIYTGSASAPGKLRFPTTAAEEDREAIINGNVPHVLPKLISDITYGTVRGWVNKFNTIEAIGNGGTALTSLVEGVEAATSLGADVFSPEIAAALNQTRQVATSTNAKKQ